MSLVSRTAIAAAVVAAVVLAIAGGTTYVAVRQSVAGTASDLEVRDIAARLLPIALSLEIGVVLLSIVAAQRVARPLLDMATYTDHIRNLDSVGDPPDEPTKLMGEVGALADALEAMLQRMREAADDERSRINAILASLDEGLVTMRADGVVESANRAAARMFGCDEAEMVGRKFRVVTADRRRARADGTVAGLLDTGEANMVGKSRKLVGRRKDGTEVPIEMSITETSVQGRNLITGVLRDLSERRHAEKALRNAQAETKKLALVASRTQNIVIIMDAAGRVEWINDAVTRITGYALEEAIGKSPGEILHGPDSDRTEIARIDAAVEAGEGFRTEISGHSKSGSRYWVEIDGQPVRDKSGRLLNFIGVGADITARKETEAELRKARDRAEEASRAKSEFLSTVSHELRTPLTSISGALGLIRAGVAGDLAPKLKSMLDIAANNCERLMQIINDILDVQKIEAGKMDYRMKRVNLAALVRESIEANRTYGRNNGVALVLGEVEENSTIVGDSDRLMQVMANLISNAVKFSPAKGEVEISVTREPPFFRITVTDHGTGIPEEFRGRIFQKFWQADSSDSRKQGGTGLGLAITKALVEHHNGRISFESEVGRGTRFHVDLPIEAGATERQTRADAAGRSALS
jgi:PAS domain S-box-containing protein